MEDNKIEALENQLMAERKKYEMLKDQHDVLADFFNNSRALDSARKEVLFSDIHEVRSCFTRLKSYTILLQREVQKEKAQEGKLQLIERMLHALEGLDKYVSEMNSKLIAKV
jgi:hypothetical protein